MEDFQKELQAVSGLELCPKCKKGHLYPVVTTSVSTESKGQFEETAGDRDYQCDICGYRQKAAKQRQNADVKKTKKLKPKRKTKRKTKRTTKLKPKRKTKRKTKTKRKRG